MPEIETLPGGVAGATSLPARYEVRIGSLADFVAFIEQELNGTLEPAANLIRTDHPHGTAWGGGLASRMVATTRTRYVDAQLEAVQNLGRYLTAGAVMMSVIEKLMRLYRHSEELAGLSAQEVLRMLREEERPSLPEILDRRHDRLLGPDLTAPD